MTIKKRAILVIVAATMLVVAAPALSAAQEAGTQGYPAGEEPPPPPPDYTFEDGEVYVSGDLVIGCREFVEDFEQGYDEYGDQAQAKRVIEQCKQAGLPTLQVPKEVRQEVRQDARSAGLPETGGVPSPFLASGLFLMCAGLWAARRLSRAQS